MGVDDALKAAAAAKKKKDAAGLVRALEDALFSARRDAPLEIRVAVPINHNHTTLGVFTPAPGDAFQGRLARLYIEVANFALTQVGPVEEGRFRGQLDVSGAFRYDDTSEGKPEVVELQTVSLGSQAWETHSTCGLISFGVEMKLSEKSPAGTYHVLLTVKDAVGGKTATRDVRFVLT